MLQMRGKLLIVWLLYMCHNGAHAFTTSRLGRSLLQRRETASVSLRRPLRSPALHCSLPGAVPSLSIPPTVPKVPFHAENKPQWVDIFHRLYRERIIFLGQELNDQIANHVIATIMYLDREDSKQPIYLYINSPGGSVVSGLAIYDAMQQARCEIVTVNIGLAGSMSSLLLAGGTLGRRYALPHSRIFIHEPEPADYGYLQVQGMEAQLQKVKASILQIYSDSTAKPAQQIEQDLKAHARFSADDALQYGLVDDIIVSDPLNSGLTANRVPQHSTEFKDCEPPGSRLSKTEQFEPSINY